MVWRFFSSSSLFSLEEMGSFFLDRKGLGVYKISSMRSCEHFFRSSSILSPTISFT
jgi:hypothetical protein